MDRYVEAIREGSRVRVFLNPDYAGADKDLEARLLIEQVQRDARLAEDC